MPPAGSSNRATGGRSTAVSHGGGSEASMNRRDFAWTVMGGAILPALAGHVAASESSAQERTSPPPPSPSAARTETAHPATGHEVHLSAPALPTDPAGPLAAGMTQ